MFNKIIVFYSFVHTYLVLLSPYLIMVIERFIEKLRRSGCTYFIPQSYLESQLTGLCDLFCHHSPPLPPSLSVASSFLQLLSCKALSLCSNVICIWRSISYDYLRLLTAVDHRCSLSLSKWDIAPTMHFLCYSKTCWDMINL